MYEVYTDGAVSGNGKADAPGGWAYVILKGSALPAALRSCRAEKWR